MPRSGLPDSTKAAIRARVAAGDSHREVARALDVSISTVAKFAGDLVDVRERSRTQNAVAASKLVAATRQDFDQAARIALINKMAVRIAEALDEPQMPRDLKDLAVAMGVAIDKRRLEDGESDGSAPSTLIQIQAVDYRIAAANLAPSIEGRPVAHLAAPGEAEDPGDGSTLG